jgi:ADP-ribosyltransferase-like protein
MADDQIPASPTPAGDPLPATPASVQPLDFSAVPGHQQHGPAPQPTGFLENLSQTTLGTTHPIDQAKAELKSLYGQPLETIKQSGKNAIMMPVELAYQLVHHPVDTITGITGGPQFAQALQNKDIPGMAGAVVGGLANVGGIEAGSEAAAPIASHLAETGKTFVKNAAEEGHAALAAKHPEGSLEAGFAKIPGYRKEPTPPQPSAPPEHAAYEIQRLEGVLRNPGISPAEKSIATRQLQDYREMFGVPATEGSLGSISRPTAKPAAETPAWQTQAKDTEIQRLEKVQRSPEATPEERRVSGDQLRDYRGENADPKSIVESAGGVFRHSKNGLTEITLPASMTDKLNLSPAMKDWVSVTIPDGEVTPENVKARMEQKFKEFGGKTEEPKTQPNDQVANSAQRYNAARGHGQIDHTPQELPAQEERNRLADSYDRAKHEPENPAVARAYDAMKRETLDQFNHAKNDLGIKFDFTKDDPYKSAEEMQKDVRENHHLSTFTEGTPLAKDHPLAEVEPTTGQTYNNIFRATHDIFGHSAGGHDFSEAGEENAYRAHKQMYSPEAVPAVQNETQGQANHYFNNERARNGAEKVFPEQKATIIHSPEVGQTPEPESPNADIPESQQTATPETGYHPTLQAIADKHGVTEDPYAVRNGASFITPDGKYIHLGSTSHDDAILAAGAPEGDGDPRIPFINDSGAIRTRVSFDRSGHTIHISVPKDGVTPEQVQALKEATQKSVGKNGNVVMERADVTAETKDQLSKTKEFGNANDIEPMLHQIQAHPDDKWYAQAGKRAEKEPAGGIDPRTGKSDTEGHGTEIFPEKRMALDHAPTKEDFQNFYEQNKELFDQHPELKIGWDNDSKVPGGHEINIGAVGKGAKRVAKKLEQRAAFDIGKGEEIPTGGEGLRTEFPNYPLAERIKDLNGEPQSDIKGFESLSPEFHANLEPDERAYLKDNNLLQSNAMSQYHKIQPSVNETTNAMQAGAALGGWWQRYIDVFHGLGQSEEVAPHPELKGTRVADDAGNPLKVYHGTTKSFDQFKKGTEGIFFTVDPDIAEKYTGEDFGANIRPAYLNIKKPLTITPSEYLHGQTKNGMLLLDAKKHGFDGLHIAVDPNDSDPDYLFSKDTWVAFNPKQVTSAFRNPNVEKIAQTIGPSHAEVLKQWHAAVSGNKAVEDANNLAWHSYADWLDAGKPTDRKSIDDIVRKNAAQPLGSGKKGNAAISDTRTKKGKLVTPGLDTTKLFNLVNSPEMKGERPFSGQVFSEEQKNPLMGTKEGARKIPSMGATVAGKGNLNRLVIDAHIRDFYGHKQAGGPAAQYIADSVHLRQAAKALGLKGGEGQEQLWGTVLGLKTLLKEGLTPEEASGKLNADVINQIGKDYAEVIANDPEIPGVLDRLKKLGVGRGSAGLSETNLPARSAGAGEGPSGSSEAGIDKTELTKTAGRIREQISPSKIKKPASSTQKASEGGWLKMMTAPVTKAKR